VAAIMATEGDCKKMDEKIPCPVCGDEMPFDWMSDEGRDILRKGVSDGLCTIMCQPCMERFDFKDGPVEDNNLKLLLGLRIPS
jgi:hypothetical protein